MINIDSSELNKFSIYLKIKSEEDKKKFILAFRDLTKVLTKLKTFTQFEFKEENLGMSEQTYQDFKRVARYTVKTY